MMRPTRDVGRRWLPFAAMAVLLIVGFVVGAGDSATAGRAWLEFDPDASFADGSSQIALKPYTEVAADGQIRVKVDGNQTTLPPGTQLQEYLKYDKREVSASGGRVQSDGTIHTFVPMTLSGETLGQPGKIAIVIVATVYEPLIKTEAQVPLPVLKAWAEIRPFVADVPNGEKSLSVQGSPTRGFPENSPVVVVVQAGDDGGSAKTFKGALRTDLSVNVVTNYPLESGKTYKITMTVSAGGTSHKVMTEWTPYF